MVFATICREDPSPNSCRVVVLRLCLLLSGCVTTPYHYGAHARYYESQQLADITETQIERGQSRRFIDGVGWVAGIPDKILLWNRRIENHNVSAGNRTSNRRLSDEERTHHRQGPAKSICPRSRLEATRRQQISGMGIGNTRWEP